MSDKKFATAINCMDGRVQTPVQEWMKGKFGVDYVDMITEPGPDKYLREQSGVLVENIKNRVLVSVNAHGSGVVAIVAHYDCAGNPAPKDSHLEQMNECESIIKSWDLPVKVIKLWVDENWSVEEV